MVASDPISTMRIIGATSAAVALRQHCFKLFSLFGPSILSLRGSRSPCCSGDARDQSLRVQKGELSGRRRVHSSSRRRRVSSSGDQDEDEEENLVALQTARLGPSTLETPHQRAPPSIQVPCISIPSFP